MYSDPADYTGLNDGDDRVYPDTWWLPPDGVQRGSVFTGAGDPLTPGYPSNGEKTEAETGRGVYGCFNFISILWMEVELQLHLEKCRL